MSCTDRHQANMSESVAMAAVTAKLQILNDASQELSRSSATVNTSKDRRTDKPK